MKYTEEEKKSLKFLTDKRDEAHGLMQFEDGEIYQLAEEEFNNYLTIEEIIEKQQKEIEEKDKLICFNRKYINELEQDLFENASNYVVPKESIREKIKDLRYNESLGFEQSFEETFKIEVLEELLGE